MAQFDCFKCGGSGKVSFRHIENGDCFQCGASGKLSYQPHAKVQADPHPELLVPEANRSTVKQWDYLGKLCNNSDAVVCRIMKQAGAPMATGRYVSKAVMSRAIELAKKEAA